MPAKKRKQGSSKKFQRGSIGNFFVFGVLALLLVVGITAVGGLPSQNGTPGGQEVFVVTPTTGPSHSTLQLQTFGYSNVVPPPPNLCKPGGINSEQGVIIGYSPAQGETVSATGQIKIWLNDEGAPMIAPNEIVDPTTGAITTQGNRSAKASDGYYYEPALYVAPQIAESGGTPHFPVLIKGQFNNNPNNFRNVITGATIDPLPPGTQPTQNTNGNRPNIYKAEYIWNVPGLGIAAGAYQVEFLIHDGDLDREVGCIAFQIQ